MKRHSLFALIAIASAVLSCNMPAAAGPSNQTAGNQSATTMLAPTDTQPAATFTATATLALTDTPTFTPTATATSTITPTPTPAVPMVTPLKDSVNCRFGPGTEYVGIGALLVGSSVPILGKSSDGGWWLIQNPNTPGENCWVAGSVTVASGNLPTVGVVAAPATFVTKVTISADPTIVHAPGCTFPVSIGYSAVITVNGPLTVQWHWQLSQGDATAPEPLTFASFGSQTLEDNHHVGAVGDYWVKIIIDSPNNITAKANYKAVCP